MEQLILNQFKLLPEHLKLEVLHYIQFLLSEKIKEEPPIPKAKKPIELTFSDFHFPESGQTYSREEIYGDDGR